MSTMALTTDEDKLKEEHLATLGVEPTPLPDIQQDDEVTDADPGGATQVDMLEAQQEPGRAKKRKRHKPMKAKEQIDAIKYLEQGLEAFKQADSLRSRGAGDESNAAAVSSSGEVEARGPSKRQRTKSVSSTKQNQEVPNAFLDMVVDSALESVMSTSPPAAMSSTSPRLGNLFENPEQFILPVSSAVPLKHHRKKEREPSPRARAQQDMNTIMNTLNDFGLPREDALSASTRLAEASLKSQGEDGSKMIPDLRLLEKQWKDANRAHLKKMVAFLEHNGVVPFGGVDVPGDEAIVLD